MKTSRMFSSFAIACACLCGSLPAIGQEANIGLYSDEAGNTCSFTGDAPGQVTAYVVFRPRPDGATAVQFAGPIPPCFGGSLLNTTSPFSTIVGTLTNGMAIAFGGCVTGGVNVLTVTYLRTGGNTAPCCAYSLIEAFGEQNVIATDCAFEIYDVQSITSYFNANAECACTTLNSPPAAPSNPSPANQALNVKHSPQLSWFGSDPDGDLEEFDLYFGTSPNPPLLVSGLTNATYTPGLLNPLTQYYWRVVARDADNQETSGPVWTFTTRLANTPPLAPSNPAPDDGQLAVFENKLVWTGGDPDGDPLLYDVYFGTVNPPSLVASDIVATNYAPGISLTGLQYYWRVVAKDGEDETSSPTWTFTTAAMGDVNRDGLINLADANCALRMAVFDLCGVFPINDVNCDQTSTARDARCIHKHVVDGSCTFCNGTASLSSTSHALPPVLSASPAFYAGNGEQGVYVYLSGVPALEAFVFRMTLDPNVALVDALPFGVSTAFEGLAHGGLPFLPQFAAVGGYTIGSVPANDIVGLVELRFVVSGPSGNAVIAFGVDDLANANTVSIVLDATPPLPVFISHFEAMPADNGVDVSWEFSADEPVATFTLYRRMGAEALPVAIAEGDANRTQSFADRSVLPTTTYRYELVIRTQDGGEYRSPIATVTTAELALELRQNHPNPFNPTTAISFDIPGAATTTVRLSVYDAAGRLVRTLVNERMPGGSHAVEWNGRDERGNAASSGVYFYVLDAGKERLTRKMVLLK